MARAPTKDSTNPLSRLVGELVSISIPNVRLFVGELISFDPDSRLLELAQLADAKPALICLDAIAAIEPVRDVQPWASGEESK